MMCHSRPPAIRYNCNLGPNTPNLSPPIQNGTTDKCLATGVVSLWDCRNMCARQLVTRLTMLAMKFLIDISK